MINNTTIAYGSVSKFLHWTVGLAIIALLAVGLYMEDLEPAPFKFQLYGIHKAVGAIVLGLVVLRVFWTTFQTKPNAPMGMAPATYRMVSFGHAVLYGFMVLMPLSGWIMSNAAGYPVDVFGFFTLPEIASKNEEVRHFFGEVHELAGYGLIAMLAAHILAAIWHHVVKKDDTLQRMLPAKCDHTCGCGHRH